MKLCCACIVLYHVFMFQVSFFIYYYIFNVYSSYLLNMYGCVQLIYIYMYMYIFRYRPVPSNAAIYFALQCFNYYPYQLPNIILRCSIAIHNATTQLLEYLTIGTESTIIITINNGLWKHRTCLNDG